MKNKHLWLLFFFNSNFLFSQSIIKGNVKDLSNNPIIGASILLRDSTNTIITSYAITNHKGFYKINAIKYIGKAYLSVNSLGYRKEVEKIYFSTKSTNLIKNFYLKEEATMLEEVRIKTRIPIRVKNDTVSYAVEKFTDGTEEVIEDVIKKLPGIDVSDNGKITYKGKPIDKVLIEGDDMFDKNYTIATKNIGSAVIDKVQAIENYQENKNLKGVKDSNKQVLNILLKEDVKAKPYGNGNFAYGYKNRFDISLNLIGVNKKNKYYVLGSTNNIGINPSPYDYFSLPSNLDEDEKSVSTLINSNYFLPNIKPRRLNKNESIFGATNLIFKPTKKLRIKSNFFITKDKNILNRETENIFIFGTENIIINENQNLIRNPFIIEGQLGFDYDISKTSEVNYDTKIKVGEIKTNSNQNTSNGLFDEFLMEQDFFINQNLKYTNRINNKSALLITTNYLYNKKPQEYFVTPSIQSNLISTQPIDNVDYKSFQKSRITLNNFSFQSEYISTHKKGNYNLGLAFFDTSEKLNSEFYFQNVVESKNISTNLINNLENKQQHFFIEFKDKRKFNKWNFVYGLSGNLKSIELNNIPQKKTCFISPKVGTEIRLGSNSKFTSIYSYGKKYPLLSELYADYVLINYRTLSKGTENINLISSHTFLTNFTYSDWFNQFNFFVNFIYLNNDNAYTSKIQIDDTITLSEKILVSGNKNYIGAIEASKYLPFISSTIKFKANLSWYDYFNIVNSSELRNNLSFSSNYKASLKSAFDGVFNFETSFNLLKSIFTTSESPNKIKNDNVEVLASIIIKPTKKWTMKITNEQLLYNIGNKNKSAFYFLDVDLKYIYKKNKLSFKLIGRNLLNETRFEIKSIGDYFSSIQKFDLLPRHLLLEMNYRF
tara:strand:- start:215 stop:2869 length:2655 start_codon:yes stop_codon:yes gene_type:complete